MTPPARITHVETTLCAGRGRPRTLELAKYNVLVGEVGAGKTRVVTSCELPLTMAADDYMGKSEVKNSGDLAALIPPGEDKLSITLVFEGGKLDGEDATFNVALKDDGGVSNPERVLPKALRSVPEWHLLPVREVASWLRKDQKKAREKFLPFVVCTVSAEDIARKIQPKYREDERAPCPTSVDTLLAAVERAEDRIREERARKKNSERLAKQREDELGAEPTDAALQGAEAAVKAAQAVLSASSLYIATSELERARSKYQTGLANIDRFYPRPDPSGAPDPRVGAVLHVVEAGRGIREILVAHSLQLEPVTGRPFDPNEPGLADRVRTMDEMHSVLSQQVEQYNTALANRKLAEDILEEARNEIDRLELQVDQTRLSLAEQGLEVQADQAVPFDQAQQNFNSALALLDRLKRARQSWEEARRLRGDADDAEEQEKWWAGYLEGLRKAVTELFKAGLEDFCTHVTRYMMPGYVFHLSLEEHGRQCFKIGVEHEGQVYYFLSGGQLTMSVFALTAVVLERLPEGPPPFALFVPPWERGWGARTLKEFMRAISKVEFPWQIILPSTVLPKGPGKLGSEWLVHDLDDLAEKMMAQNFAGDAGGDEGGDGEPKDPEVPEEVRETDTGNGGGNLWSASTAPALDAPAPASEGAPEIDTKALLAKLVDLI